MEYKDYYAQEHLQKYSDHDSFRIIDKKRLCLSTIECIFISTVSTYLYFASFLQIDIHYGL